MNRISIFVLQYLLRAVLFRMMGRPSPAHGQWSLIPLLLVFSALLTTGRAETYGDFTYTSSGTSVTITGYTGPGGNITIPDTIGDKPVTVIGNKAFYQSTNLTSVTIPNSVAFIDNNAFTSCAGLINIKIPNSVTNIGNSVFYDCGRLTEVTIPNSVTSLGYGTFANCYALTNVTLPNGITNIKDSMFKMCTHLASITIPDGVTSIDPFAFTLCVGVTNIAIPNGVVSIGFAAFNECSGLVKLSIPATVTQIDLFAFSHCSNLTAISVDPLNATYASVDGVLFDKSQTTLLKYPECKAGDYLVPSAVNNLGNASFAYSTKLINVTLPDGLITIGPSAFSGCTKLAYVNIPDSVTTIQDKAFYRCSSLTNIAIPESVISIGGFFGVDAFARCSSLTNITVDPANTNYSSLDGVLFNKSQNTLLQFPGGRTGSYMIPNTVDSIRESSLSCCVGMTNFSVDPLNPSFSSVDGVLFANTYINNGKTLIACPGGRTGGYTIPNNVFKLGGYAFSDCAKLTNITIPNNVSIISSNAFYQCSGLSSIIIPGNVYKLCDSAFLGCVGLTSITIPRSVSSIEDYCFISCSNLTSVYCEGKAPSLMINVYSPFLYANLVTVYYRAGTTGWGTTYGGRPTSLWNKTEAPDLSYQQMGSAYAITGYLGAGGNVLIPEFINGLPVTSIADYAFAFSYGSKTITNLTSVTIPNTVTSIGGYAFFGCTGLTNVIIPAGVTNIGYDAFYGCSALTDVTIPIGVEAISPETFYGCINLANITIPEGVTSIGDTAFRHCISLLNISLPTSVLNIGSAAFSDCTALTNITMPENSMSIGSQCFSNCVVLWNIAIPNGVCSIERSAFYHCNNLTNVTLPSSVTSIDVGAFYSCASLTNIFIPASVTNIASSAFSWCVNLKCAVFEGNAPTFVASDAFIFSSNARVYYHAGTTGWGSLLGGSPTSLVDYNIMAIGTNVTILQYTGTNSHVDIPDSVQGKNVGVIGTSAFKGCATLTDIKISDNVYKIGSSAFSGCANLANVVFGRGVSNILDSAFANCARLTRITIPSNVVYIRFSAFSNCSNLTQVYFEGNAPATIAPGLFSGSTNVTVYYRAGTTGWGPTFAGQPTALWVEQPPVIDFTYTTNGLSATITGYTGAGGNITIPDQILGLPVISIGDSAFANNTNLTSVTIPNSVTNIGSPSRNGAFIGCSGLTNVTLPNSLHLIWENTFQRCTHLTSIIIPDGVGSIRDAAFEGCTALTNITIPNSVTTIWNLAFSGCVALRNAIIPDGVETIMMGAFQGCYGLTNVFIPKSVTSIWESAFNDCAILPAITVDPLNQNYTSAGGVLFNKTQTTLIQCPAGLKGDYVVPSGVTNIGNSAFLGSGNLNNVTIPKSLSTIGDYGFAWCSNLTGVYFEGIVPRPVPSNLFYGATNVTVFYRAGITGWGTTLAGRPTAVWMDPAASDFAYKQIGSQIEITGYTGVGGAVAIPSTLFGMDVTSIGDSAFIIAETLTSVTIPDGVQIIGNSAFCYCQNMTNLVIGSGVTNILDSAFASCSSLTRIAIPASVTQVGVYSFADCTSLTNLTISTGLTNIAALAFVGCTSLPAFTVDQLNPAFTSADGVLYDKSQSTLIQCPAGRTGACTVPESIGSIGKNAFDSCMGLTNIIFPTGITNMGEYAFWRCTGLTGVYFKGNAPTTVPANIFALATNVTVYYRAGTTGWGTTFAGRPTALWIEQPTYQEWTTSTGLAAQFPDASAESDDADHDGMTNLAEMQAGTDPTTADSALRFERTPRPDDLVDDDKTAISPDQHALYFQTVPGKQYEVQSVTTFGGTWQPVTSITATTTQKRVLVTKPVDHQFYRLVLVP